MRKHQTQKKSAFISAVFILSIILSSCATATPVIPGEIPDLEPEPQTPVDVPGGLMVLPDGSGVEHPVLVFDFQIQSRLVTSGEYQECVESGGCEPGPEAIHEYAPAGVSWDQAQAYCSYLGGRLPTEAELSRASGADEDCSESGEGLVKLEGFGEWVYDWDDPDYYNGSLVTNPFGPSYGDLKVALGLDLSTISEVMYKYFGKYEDPESFAKYDGSEVAGKVEEDDGSFAKYDDDASFIKLDELKITFAKYDGQYVIKFEDGKFFIGTGDGEFIKVEGSDQDNIFPRMGILPDQSNPLVGFRCVTEGAALTFAPICKTETASLCSIPSENLETLSEMPAAGGTIDANFQIIGANCPDGNQVDISISHELASGEDVEVKTEKGDCKCQEYADYPNKLYCSCPSPGAGSQLGLEVCQAETSTLIPVSDFCPAGSQFDFLSFKCVKDQFAPPTLFSLAGEVDSTGASNCPTGPGLPVPQYGPLTVAAANVEGVGESALPEGDQWELFSLSDGSGMCPPGYAYNQETGCCSPYSEENYDCGPDEYFDAGKKQCLPVDWDGCGPCQVYDAELGCIGLKDRDMLGGRCNVGNENEVGRDDLGRSVEPSGDCPEGAYRDTNLGMCLETRDGCAIGYFLDPKTGRCRPLSGHESPCTEGYTFSPLSRCCVPAPGEGGSEYPEGAAPIDSAFPDIIAFAESGCPTSHFYDEDSDSCLLLVGGKCPGGTTKNFIGECIPDVPGVCPDGTEYYPTSGTCPSGPLDPALCTGDKVFDASVGFCLRVPGQTARGGAAGDCELEDLEVPDTIGEDGKPELAPSCAGDDSSYRLLPFTMGVDNPSDPEPTPEPTPDPDPTPDPEPTPEPGAEAQGRVSGRSFYIEVNGAFLPIKSYSGGDETGERAEASSGASEEFPLEDPGILDEVWRCLMLTADKTVQEGRGFCRSQGDGDGRSEDFFTIEFGEGRIAKITRISPDVIEPAEASEPPTEENPFCFGYVFGAPGDSDKETDEDDWAEPVSGALPPVGACTPNLFIDAGSIFGPTSCTILQTTVPICAAPVPSGGGSSNICASIDNQPTCTKTTGCGWGATCVKCSSEPDQGTCDNLLGCHWDPTNGVCETD